MSEKEKLLTEQIARLPEKLQDKFLDQIKGAATALDVLSAGMEERPGNAGMVKAGARAVNGQI